MIKFNPNNGNEKKSDIFPWGIFKLTSYIFCQKISKYFNDFQDQNF